MNNKVNAILKATNNIFATVNFEIVFWAQVLSLTEFRLASENQNTPDSDQICRKIICSINVAFYFLFLLFPLKQRCFVQSEQLYHLI